MTNAQFVIASAYQGWDRYQQQLVAAITPLTAEQPALRPAPHLRSIGMLATHIVGVRAGWMHHVLGEGDAEIVALDTWSDRDQPPRSAAQLVAGLETTWQLIESRLARWTPADLEATFFDRDDQGNPTVELTRQWVIWHLIEHDLHHGESSRWCWAYISCRPSTSRLSAARPAGVSRAAHPAPDSRPQTPDP